MFASRAIKSNLLSTWMYMECIARPNIRLSSRVCFLAIAYASPPSTTMAPRSSRQQGSPARFWAATTFRRSLRPACSMLSILERMRKTRAIPASLQGFFVRRERQRIRPDERVPLDLNDRERELILHHTFADDPLTRRLRIVPRAGEPAACRFTLGELDELGWLRGSRIKSRQGQAAKETADSSL